MDMITTALINSISRTCYLFLTLLFSGSLFFSCSKDQFIDTSQTAKLSIVVSGVIDALDEQSLPRAMNGGLEGMISSTAGQVNSIKIDEFTIDITARKTSDIEELKLPNKLGSTQKKQSGNELSKAATVGMEDGIQYRILLYNTSTNKFERSEIATSGTALEIDVYKGQEYEWYAYSYNTADHIEAPDINNPQVISKTDSPLLYASGKVTATDIGSTPIHINFQHQLAQIKVEVDTRAVYGDIHDLTAVFNANYIKTGSFNIRSGAFEGSLTDVAVGELNFITTDINNNRVKVAKYYTADVLLNAYQVKFNKLDIKLPNGAIASLASKFPNGGMTTFDNYVGSSKGKILTGNLKMWTVFPRKSILHVEAYELYGTAAYYTKVASGAFIENPLNFGPSSNYFRIEGFTHTKINAAAGKLAEALANPLNYPDIIIACMESKFNDTDYTALRRYIDKGGAVFLMIEQAGTTNNQAALNFFHDLFGTGVSLAEYDAGGAVYTITDQYQEYLTWPFGDARGTNWGQHDSKTLYVSGLPLSDVEIYSTTSRNFEPQDGATMFRHKTKNFVFVGDTYFLANSSRNFQWGYNYKKPFVTSGTNSSDFPIAHTKYGAKSSVGSLDHPTSAGSWQVENSMIFGNIFSQLVATSHYMGIDKTP